MSKLIQTLFNKNETKISELDGSSRNQNIIRQIFSTFFIKIFSVAITFLSVRYVLQNLGNEKYGIWAVLISIMQWIALFDIGIGNGLKNKLAESLANDNKKDALEFVSTAYILMGGVAIILILISTPAIFFIKWSNIFNSNILVQKDYIILMGLFTYAIIIYFVLALINNVLISLQRSSLGGLMPLMANGSFLFFMLLFSNILKGNIILILSFYVVCLLFSGIIMNFIVFKKYIFLKPSIKSFKIDKIKSILNIGINFFIIQLAGIIIFSTDNIIISQVLGPQFVTKYSITLSFFNYLSAFTTIIMSPFWSSYTEAYTKQDFVWMQRVIKKMILLITPIACIAIFMVIFFNYITKVWLGKDLGVSMSFIIIVACYVLIMIWNNIYAYVIGAISKIRLGTITTIFTSILNIPLSIYLSRNLHLGLNGIVLSNIICLSFHSIITPIQVYYFIFTDKNNPKYEKWLR